MSFCECCGHDAAKITVDAQAREAMLIRLVEEAYAEGSNDRDLLNEPASETWFASQAARQLETLKGSQ